MQYLLMVGNAPDSSTHEWGESDDAAAIAWVTEMDRRGVRKVRSPSVNFLIRVP